uniref:Putative peptidase S8, subtilisin-related protein n=1 Tax=Tanacetum cinerariifolium TaxID=118510 RepID=A0A6L2NPR9_TANCI|nr:putative peptidase S8, subtilisin-related protein [Tanacetum cinerariifolium]
MRGSFSKTGSLQDTLSISLAFEDVVDVIEDPVVTSGLRAVKRNILTSIDVGNNGLVLGSIPNYTPWMIIARVSDTERRIMNKVLLGNEAILVDEGKKHGLRIDAKFQISRYVDSRTRYYNIKNYCFLAIDHTEHGTHVESITDNNYVKGASYYADGVDVQSVSLAFKDAFDDIEDLIEIGTILSVERNILTSVVAGNDGLILARKLLAVLIDLEASLNMRQAIINKGKVTKNTKTVKSVALFRELQNQELPLKRDLMLQIDETHMSTFKKREFLDYIKKNSRWLLLLRIVNVPCKLTYAFVVLKINILTSIAARNDGLVLGSIQNSTPWMIIVGASNTERRILNKVLLGNEAIIVAHAFDVTEDPTAISMLLSVKRNILTFVVTGNDGLLLGSIKFCSTDDYIMTKVNMLMHSHLKYFDIRCSGNNGLVLGSIQNSTPWMIIVGTVYKVRNVLCYTTELLIAFDDAIADGVDVQSVSLAFEDAFYVTKDPISNGTILSVERNILTFVVVGNDGLIRDSIESFAPWMITPGPSDINQSILDKVLKGNEAIIEVYFRYLNIWISELGIIALRISASQCIETTSRFLLTSSKLEDDYVMIIYDDVIVVNLKKPMEDSTG